MWISFSIRSKPIKRRLMCHEVPRKLRCATFTRTLNIRHSKKWAENLYDQSKVQQWMFRHIGSAVTASSSAKWWEMVRSPSMRERKIHHSSSDGRWCNASRTRDNFNPELLLNLQPKARMSTISLHAQTAKKDEENSPNRRRIEVRPTLFTLDGNLCCCAIFALHHSPKEKAKKKGSFEFWSFFLCAAFSLFGFGTL